MKWFSTREAAELLGISSGRVRQLVVKNKKDKHLVRQQAGKNLVSEAFIELRKTEAQRYAQLDLNRDYYSEASPSADENTYASLEDALDGLETGLHFSASGNHIQVFTPEEYKSFEQQLMEARQLARQLAQEREHRAYLEKQLDSQTRLLSNALDTLTQSQRHLTQRQFIEAKEKGLDK